LVGSFDAADMQYLTLEEDACLMWTVEKITALIWLLVGKPGKYRLMAYNLLVHFEILLSEV